MSLVSPWVWNVSSLGECLVLLYLGKFVLVKGSRRAGIWEQEDLNFLLKMDFPSDGILELLLGLFELVLLNANVTGIRNCVLTVKHS